jgi:hypothetical protein
MNEKSKDQPQVSVTDMSSSNQQKMPQGIPSKVIVETIGPTKHPQPPSGGSQTPIHRKVKQAPICRIPALRKEHMSADQLSKHCFEKEVGEGAAGAQRLLHTFSPKEDPQEMDVQSQSSSLQGNGDHSNDNTSANCSTHHDGNMNNNNHNTITVNPRAWEHFKKSILQRQESRTGRDRQRFATDPISGELLRLVTGTVPIMKDGRILLVSSSSKPEWILPKGGWESDETCEVSALRETYEEGGIIGTLGPRLKDIEFETRKGKKRRLELESLKKKVQIAYGTTGLPHAPLPSSVTAPSSSVSVSSNDRNSEACQSEDDMQLSANTLQQHGITVHTSPHHKEHHDNESFGSVASMNSELSSSANSVRMIMFPLYILEVREHWPESGRARKVVDIDTAIQIMESRPEFQKVLMEVKEKGYHLMPQENEKLDVLKSTII